MPRPSRRRRAVSAADRSADAARRRRRRRERERDAGDPCAELARPDAVAVEPHRSASALEARGRATRERMLRELTQAVEAIAAETPLVLKLEDIHWSDASTLDWLAHVARRPEPARLMVLATFRPADAAAIGRASAASSRNWPCTDDARRSRSAPLPLEAIEDLSRPRGWRRCQARAAARDRAAAAGAHRRQSAVHGLDRQPAGAAGRAAATTPARSSPSRTMCAASSTGRSTISIDADRDLSDAASVIRREFATAAVAAALDADVDTVETACARLARQGVFIVKSGIDLMAGRHADRALCVPPRPLPRAAL